MGWGGGPRGEIHVYIHLIHFVMQPELTQLCKAIILQFKNIIQAQKKKLSSPPAPSSTSDEELSRSGVPSFVVLVESQELPKCICHICHPYPHFLAFSLSFLFPFRLHLMACGALVL